ncbi:MAG: response regulator [Chloroflexi bacterium]|nr:response regulator [Chloroflexota bacterium]
MRVLLADDQWEVLSALRLLLEQEPEFTVVGEVSEADGIFTEVGETCPDVLLLDWELPDLKVAEVFAVLRSHCPALVVIALSGLPEARRAALAAGADAFVSKGDPPERLLATLHSIAEHG